MSSASATICGPSTPTTSTTRTAASERRRARSGACRSAYGPKTAKSFIVSSSADVILTRAPPMPQPASLAIEEGVIDVLKNVSRRPIEPTLASDLVADLGFDSLQVLEVIAELEDRFDISIPLNDVPTTRTVAQVVAQVAGLVAERSNA